MGFGSGPLSHPLLVEAIEERFIPLLVFNNRDGTDARLLQRFGEPAWNNPVVRFLDGRGGDVIPRRDSVWTGDALAARMLAALRAAGREVPRWLELATEELAATRPRRAVLAMHCFWEGEGVLGALDGVIATRAGFVGAEEVVEVVYDPAPARYEALVEAAQRLERPGSVYCADDEQLAVARRIAGDRAVRRDVEVRTAPDADRKRALRASPLWWVPMTPLQQSRVNGALARGEDPTPWLSPRQAALGRRLAEAAREAPVELGRPPAESLADLAAYAAHVRALEVRSAPPGSGPRDGGASRR